MKFISTKLNGVYIIELEPHIDSRGFLARTFDSREFALNGLKLDITQGYTCYTEKKGTLRGLHYFIPPVAETKLVRVVHGSIFEVVVDLRQNSPTYKQWLGQSVKANNYKMVLVPPGCAHAALTLEDNTEHIAFYSPLYNPEFERGIRFNDPAFNIKWPIPIKIVSEKDKNWPDFKE